MSAEFSGKSAHLGCTKADGVSRIRRFRTGDVTPDGTYTTRPVRA